jgi:3-oxosteroid 1-dehydrogenase
MLSNVPSRWDMEADLVALGSGIGGLSAAITAHDSGASAIVVERAEQVGGVTALSMGEVWVPGNHLEAALGIEDSADSGFRYLRRLAMGYGSDLATLNLAVHAREALRYFEDGIGLQMEVIKGCPDYYYGATNDAVAEGRMLECLPFPADSLGEWQERTRVSPQMPYGLTHRDIYGVGGVANMMKWDFALMGDRLSRDERCLGPGLAAYFVKGALDRGVPLLTGASAEELIGDGERVVGVRVVQNGPAGEKRDLFVKANRGVVVSVSSYERNPHLNKTLSQQLELGSIVFSTVDGANFRLAGPVGAQVARVPDITPLGMMVPGEEDAEGKPMFRSMISVIGQPHAIVVNRAGRRFGNEAFYRSIYYRVEHIDGADQTHPNFPCWVVIDSQQREKYPFGPVMPGQDWPDGLGHRADSLGELARLAGIDPAGLAQTITDFNAGAERGEDPEFGRGSHPWSVWMCGDPNHQPNPNLGPLSKPPFYAVQLERLGGSAIPAAGLLTDVHSRVLDWRDQPIPGLYAAGNSVARMETGAGMQSGVSNARGMTYGWLAARHATGQPSDRLAREVERLGL